jgi:hypothetical protein
MSHILDQNLGVIRKPLLATFTTLNSEASEAPMLLIEGPGEVKIKSVIESFLISE